MKHFVPIPKRNQNPVSRTLSEFAVPKFLFTIICSLAKTKNRVRAAVALEADLNNKDIDVCTVSETHLKPETPDATVNIPGYSIFRRDRNWSGLDKRSKGGITIYARSNLKMIDVYKSKLYEMLYVIFSPKPTYHQADFLQYLTHLIDNALDQHPGLTIVAGGDVNQLDTNELIVMTGWDALVDFPTRGDANLDKVFANRLDLFAKSVPYLVSIKTDRTVVILPAGTKLRRIRQNVRIRDCRNHRKGGLYLKLVSEN